MKKTVLAIAAGCLLIAGQAAATTQSTARIGDRIGATAESSSEFAGIPIIGLLAIAGVIAATVSVATDDSESD